ncbi:MAG: DUF2513 domain-containing protein [Candidatus Thiodiazotropha sp. (ex. Lucinisca nassula)]|nr:DUF2513 domain-containing protein [Candidatus Thiodiazotropha sp. (ex. Lucinisca nassula)]
MKRDMDIVREILLSIADEGKVPSNEMIENDTLQYHLWIMQEAGLVDNFSCFGPEGGTAKNPLELTWQGNEFLEAARSKQIWDKAKEIAIEKTGSISFEIVKTILVGLAKNAVL